MIRPPSLVRVAVLLASAAAAGAQSIDVPDNPSNLPNGTTSYPWDSVGFGCRVMYMFGQQGFLGQGVTFPITIQDISHQTASTVPGAATYPTVTVECSTGAPGLHTAYSMVDFASNHGVDRAVAFSGSVTTAAPDPEGYFVTVPLSTPFGYDPNLGDLVLDIALDGGTATGTGTRAVGPNGLSGLGSRIYHPTDAAATAPVGQNTGFALRTRIGYIPKNGLFPAFEANTTRGPGPLTVQFTDRTYSSDPAGVIAWAWDLDGNGTVDSTQQNPTFTFSACGDYDVELQVTDMLHGTQTLRRTAYVAVDPLTADFSVTALGGSTVQFSDLSSTSATSWSWDFDNDGTVDSTQQSPVHTYPAKGRYTVVLTVNNGCRGDAVTRTISTDSALATTFEGGNGLSDAAAAVLMDVLVTNPSGIVLTGLDVSALRADATGSVELFVTQDGYAGAVRDPAAWRLAATANAALTGGAGSRDYVDLPEVFLAPGSYGLAISTSGGLSYTDGTTPTTTFANADLTLTCGAAQQARFSTAPYSPRVWNGTLYYDAFDVGAYGFVGTGCAGSIGPTITAVPGTGPRIGSTLVLDLAGMPANGGAAVMVLGFSTTLWNGQPLPVDLTTLGLTGCAGRVDPFQTFLVPHANGSAQWSLPIPVVSAFVGDLFYNQALVLDPAANALGAVMSDAAGGRIGS